MKTRCLRYSKNKGAILVSVMISTALLLTAATAFSWYARNEILRAEAVDFAARSRSAAETACLYLSKKIAGDRNGFDSRSEPLYAYNSMLRAEIDGLKISIEAEPLDKRIPINGVLLPDGVTLKSEYEGAWSRAWEDVGLPRLSAVVLDFLDTDSNQRLGGREREMNIDRKLTDLTELKLIEEIDEAVLWGTKDQPACISRYFTVYGDEKVNINTAPPEVIAIMDERVDIAQARNFVAARMIFPLRSLDDLKRFPQIEPGVITRLSSAIAFESSYFRVEIGVSDGSKREKKFRIILKREKESCALLRWEE